MWKSRILLTVVTLAWAIGWGANAPAAECPISGTAPLLTVTGAIAIKNRPGTGSLDRFLAHQNQSNDGSLRLTADRVSALPQGSVDLVVPYDERRHVLSGPLLDAVLEAAGAGHSGVRLAGIDGYAVEFKSEEIATLKPILAQCIDGIPLAIGDLGPFFLAHVPAAGPGTRPVDDEFARMIWGVYLVTALKP